MSTAIFTTTGSWTCPARLNYVNVEIIGAGKGGAAGNYYSTNGGGGAAGSRTAQSMVPVTPGQTYTITVGTGGSGGFASNTASDRLGQDGGASSAFGYSAAGGSSYTGGITGANGPSGSYSGNAQNGTAGYPPNGRAGGSAGSYAGAGGGGGGASSTPEPTLAGNGGAGSNGIIVITYYVSTPSIGAVPTSGNAPLDVTFTGSVSEGSVSAWSWQFGDGGTSGTQNPTHQYTLVGAKTVTLTVTTSYGSWSTTATVTVYWRPSTHVFVISTEQWRH